MEPELSTDVRDFEERREIRIRRAAFRRRLAIAALVPLCALLGVGMAVYVIVSLVKGHTVAGWASLMMSIWLLGGLQLMALGMIGEYVGKIYLETKRRPKFILEEHLWDGTDGQ